MGKTVLLVEDSEDDIFFARRAFEEAGLLASLNHVEDGQKAIEYLSAKGPYADRMRFPIPSVALLDIKLPFISGLEVLKWIREQSGSPRLPVIVFTSSDQERDVEKAYALGANAYVMKPARAEYYSNLVTLIKRFWIDVNIPPPPKPESGETLRSKMSFPLPVLHKTSY